MDLLAMSDAEILQVANPIYSELIEASNSRNWNLFVKRMPQDLVSDELRLDVENQWDNVPFLTALSEKRELLGVLRRESSVHVLWKQWTTINDTEYLGVLVLQEVDGVAKVPGFFIK